MTTTRRLEDVLDAMRDGLERVRTNRREHVVALLAVVVVGLLLAWLHWLGLVVAGALVGLASRTLSRAVLGGLGFGVVVLVAFALSLGADTWTVLETTPVVYLTVAAALGLPVVGSLVRGVL